MPDMSKDDIVRKMEALNKGGGLNFRLSSTFGGGAVIVELNPSYGEKGQKNSSCGGAKMK